MLKTLNLLIVFVLVFVCALGIAAQDITSIYTRIKSLDLKGGKADVTGLSLKRDRLEMTFTGTFYLAEPVDGKITGAVFSGKGTFRAEAPRNEYERANLKRLTGVEDAVESDFTTAVMRFSDDTASLLGAAAAGAAPTELQKLATEAEARVLEETGVNLSSRVMLSILNREAPGFFFAVFDGGKRGRFSAVLDHQTRIPTDHFAINAGEKGLIFKYDSSTNGNDVWLAFHSAADYSSGRAAYSDSNDVVDLVDYEMQIDLTEPKKRLGLKTRITMTPLRAGVYAVPFVVGESLGESEDQRLKKQMRIKAAGVNGKPVSFVQEDWEAGFTIISSSELKAGETINVELELEGDFLQQPQHDISYPLNNATWYPRHGYLDRATYKLTYLHSKNVKVASIGTRRSEGPKEDGKFVTRYEMTRPVSLITFAAGPFTRHTEMIKWDKGGKPTPLEFNSLDHLPIEEGLMMAEMNNSVRYFHQLFGEYPYETYSGTVHPFGFGQGFPSMLMIPPTNHANADTYSFLSHETAHQWWGNIVAWRSYRDQWLSEGFAEYSAVVYTNLRKDRSAGKDLIDEMRRSLREPPRTQTGFAKGKLSDVGPIVLGHRLQSKKTLGGYNLVYNKGALVLRMLHFLFTDPNSGSGEPFYAMMRDFVSRYRDKTASTDDFRVVANEHFAKTPIAAEYKIQNLDWFFHQWVYQATLPSYRLEYKLVDQPDGSCLLSGNIIQENAPNEWFMPLPVVFKFGGDQVGQTVIAAYGPNRPVKLRLPRRPKGVELDPARWVLSDKTSMN